MKTAKVKSTKIAASRVVRWWHKPLAWVRLLFKRAPQNNKTIKVDAYSVLMDAYENSITYGLRRYWKHRAGGPDECELQQMAAEIANAGSVILCENLKFE